MTPKQRRSRNAAIVLVCVIVAIAGFFAHRQHVIQQTAFIPHSGSATQFRNPPELSKLGGHSDGEVFGALGGHRCGLHGLAGRTLLPQGVRFGPVRAHSPSYLLCAVLDVKQLRKSAAVLDPELLSWAPSLFNSQLKVRMLHPIKAVPRSTALVCLLMYLAGTKCKSNK